MGNNSNNKTGEISGSAYAQEEDMYQPSSEISDRMIESEVRGGLTDSQAVLDEDMKKNPQNYSENDIEVNNRTMDKIRELSETIEYGDDDFQTLMKTGFYMQYSDSELSNFRENVISEMNYYDTDDPEYQNMRNIVDKIDVEELSRRVHSL